ncbi:MAG TPA: glutamyl-tRNA reductase [Nitrospirae bacterium]|nr:glutamyl-tRNA reductase [bacterium BMS3Abin06]HDH12847.1 glutamyl-tRNA reductase [Nitrospirota bacterium]HDZ01624.1 glutamyl-tRNA reductase [Nitrospirota bacterium]
MNILVVGLNHKTATVEIREKIAFDGPKLGEAVNILKDSPGIKENIILSTCNRVEIYAGVNSSDSGTENIKNFIAGFHNVPREALDKALYIYEGQKAIKHVFRVASSLDSMMVGEPQILGQLKDAYDFALKSKSTGVYLNKLMKKAVSVAKRIRTETKIAENAVSISFAAVELAKKIFEDLSTKSFMLIGAGEMAELAAKNLINNGVRDVFITNRTYSRAEELAGEFDGKAIPFDDFVGKLLHTDIVICSTGAPDYILRKEQLHRIMKERKQRPMFIIDISVPRNIDPEINDLDNVYLYDVDDLKGIINTNIEERGREAAKAEKIVDVEVASFLKWQDSLAAVPAIIALRGKAEAIRKEELEKTLRKISPLEEEKIKAIEYLSASIVNKLIHAPTAALKTAEDDQDVMVDMAKRLFDLEPEENNGEKK